MAVRRRSIRGDTGSAEKSIKTPRAKSQIATPNVIGEVVALRRFKDLMKKNAGKLKFASE
jgi:hypothetical protein